MQIIMAVCAFLTEQQRPLLGSLSFSLTPHILSEINSYFLYNCCGWLSYSILHHDNFSNFYIVIIRDSVQTHVRICWISNAEKY